jgi:hypothetical protein
MGNPPPSAQIKADQAQRPREVRGALACDRRRTPIRIRVRTAGSRRSSPYPETGTLAADELADHQPHVDGYIAQAQLKTRGLKRDPPTRNPGPEL